MKKFQSYQQKQGMLLPPNLDELIGISDLARVIDEVVEEVSHDTTESYFTGGGRPSYHPLMIIDFR